MIKFEYKKDSDGILISDTREINGKSYIYSYLFDNIVTEDQFNYFSENSEKSFSRILNKMNG